MLDTFLLIFGVSVAIYIQSIFGFAAGMIAMPILLLALPFDEAMVFLSIFLALFSITQIKICWRDINVKMAFRIGISLVIGLTIGVYILSYSEPQFLKRVLGLLIMIYAIYSRLEKNRLSIFKNSEIPFGLLGGFMSGLFAAGGPFYVISISNNLSSKKTIRATIIAVLAISNVGRIPLLIATNMFSLDIIFKAIWVLPFFFLSIYLGNKKYKKIQDTTFKEALSTILFFTGLVMILF